MLMPSVVLWVRKSLLCLPSACGQEALLIFRVDLSLVSGYRGIFHFSWAFSTGLGGGQYRLLKYSPITGNTVLGFISNEASSSEDHNVAYYVSTVGVVIRPPAKPCRNSFQKRFFLLAWEFFSGSFVLCLDVLWRKS